MKILLLTLMMIGCSAHALEPVVFGPEFTFTDLQSNKVEKVLSAIRRMDQHLVSGQPIGEQFDHTVEENKEHFVSPNGWWFETMIEGFPDHHGFVLEVTMKPGTVEYFRQFKDDMQDAIFVSAANEGLTTAMFRGGGHINLSMETFKGNNLLLRNFIVDLINHDELFMGVFGYDTNNALPFQLNSADTIAAVYGVIQKFDDGFYAQNHQPVFLVDLMTERVRRRDEFLKFWGTASNLQFRDKFFDVNFMSVVSQGRIELRGIRPQTSIDMWIRQIDLLEHRLRYLETIKQPIPIVWKVPLQEIKPSIHRLAPPLDPQLALRAFYQYVIESGLRWQDHNDYLWPKWVSDGEVTNFEQSHWFLEHERQSRCAQELVVAA